MPASLAPIFESDFGDDSTSLADIPDSVGVETLATNQSVGGTDDFVLVDDSQLSKTRMRRPRVRPTTNNETNQTQSSDASLFQTPLAPTDDDIESMGSAYLDQIEEKLFVPG